MHQVREHILDEADKMRVQGAEAIAAYEWQSVAKEKRASLEAVERFSRRPTLK